MRVTDKIKEKVTGKKLDSAQLGKINHEFIGKRGTAWRDRLFT